MNHPKFTHEQEDEVPTLASLHLHRQGSAANWPPTAYAAAAEWCGKYQPTKAHLWRRFSYRKEEAGSQPEGQQ